MKFSIRQILASTVGAVIAAVIASTFGVKGTVVGVAIGSAAATFATALVAQSIERGQEAVKQVVVRAPDTSTLLRKLGSTVVSGDVDSSEEVSSPPAPATAAPFGETERVETSAGTTAPATERIEATTVPTQPGGPPRAGRPGALSTFSWKTIAGTAAIVFVIALLFVTAIELISGQPLSAVFGNGGTGTSVHDIFTPAPAPPTTTTPTTSSTTSTTTPPGSSTSTTTSTTSTSTTPATKAPSGSSTTTSTTAARSSSTTTTPGVGGTTTTSSAG